jgi:putative acetyltransferase
LLIRPYQPGDADALAQIFFDAVRIGAAPKYPAAELAAWAPIRPSAEVWAARLAPLTTFVAEAHQPIGFMSLGANGYLDLAFVAPVLVYAQSQALPLLTTEASRMARPFFLRMGWQDLARQTVERGGQRIENFKMQRICR